MNGMLLLCQVFSCDERKQKALEAVDEAEHQRRQKMEMLNQVSKGVLCAYP
jgi:hypothetical protein